MQASMQAPVGCGIPINNILLYEDTTVTSDGIWPLIKYAPGVTC